MPTLDTIPTELRRQILLEVLLSPVPPPESPSTSQSRERILPHSALASARHGIWLQDAPAQYRATPLLLTCRLINAEVQDITSGNKHVKDFNLDLMWVKTAGIWPTWTSLPAFTRHVHTLTTTFRIFNPPSDLDPKFNRSLLFYYGCGGRGGVWTPYNLLTGFLSQGPCLRKAVQEPVPAYSIRNLILDVLAPPEDEDHSIVGPHDQRRWGEGDEEDTEFFAKGSVFTEENWPRLGWARPSVFDVRTIPAEKLAFFMAAELRSILRLGYHTMNYGLIFYEAILDTIDIRVNGETRMKFDMANMLEVERLDFGSTAPTVMERRARYAVWLKWVKERRRLCWEGKPVGHNVKRPHYWVM